MKTKNNPWKVATIILAILLLALIIVDVSLNKDESKNPDLNNLIKVASKNGTQEIQLCDLEIEKCLPPLKFIKNGN